MTAVSDPIEYLHAATDHVVFVDVPDRQMLVIDGLGEPGGVAFQEAVSALYAAAASISAARHRAGIAMHPGPLEGLWWTVSGEEAVLPGAIEERAGWHWRLMIEAPPDADAEEVEAAVSSAAETHPHRGLERIRLIRFSEGRCAQILHRGPYADELPTLRRLEEGAHAAGCELHGRHHEIYLGDPRRTPPDRWRTILRHPVHGGEHERLGV